MSAATGSGKAFDLDLVEKGDPQIAIYIVSATVWMVIPPKPKARLAQRIQSLEQAALELVVEG